MTDQGELQKTTVFEAGEDGYPCCRIPSTVVTREGTVLAFCEGRQSRGDESAV